MNNHDKIQELIGGIEMLPHPAYSTDFATSDYQLFRSMAHFLCTRNFENIEAVVHRCGVSGSMRACHAAAPGSIPGRDKFPG